MDLSGKEIKRTENDDIIISDLQRGIYIVIARHSDGISIGNVKVVT